MKRSLQVPVWRKGLGLLTKDDLSWDLRVPWTIWKKPQGLP